MPDTEAIAIVEKKRQAEFTAWEHEMIAMVREDKDIGPRNVLDSR